VRHAIGNVVDNHQNGPYNCHIGLILHFLTICWEHSQHPRRLGPYMPQLRQQKSNAIGIGPAAGKEGVDMFGLTWVAAE
jgi:hypothetical protein